MSGGDRQRGLFDELWRASLTVLFTVIVIYIAWQLIQQFIGPLLIIIVLLGVTRLALGLRSRRGW